MSYIQPLTYELQQVKLDISAVYEAVDNNLRTLKEARQDVDKKHKEWYHHAKLLAIENNIPITMPRTAPIQRHRENHEADTIEEYYRRSLTIPFLDTIITELEERFRLSIGSMQMHFL